MEKEEKADFWDLMYYLFWYIRVVKFVAPIITRYNNLKDWWDRNKIDIGNTILFCLWYAIRYWTAMYACSIME